MVTRRRPQAGQARVHQASTPVREQPKKKKQYQQNRSTAATVSTLDSNYLGIDSKSSLKSPLELADSKGGRCLWLVVPTNPPPTHTKYVLICTCMAVEGLSGQMGGRRRTPRRRRRSSPWMGCLYPFPIIHQPQCGGDYGCLIVMAHIVADCG